MVRSGTGVCRIASFVCAVVSVLGVAGFAVTIMSPDDFSEMFARKIRDARPQATVEIVEPLRLSLKTRESQESTVYLTSAYDVYKQSPTSIDEILERYVAGSLEKLTAPVKIDPSKIVPVVKDRAWLDQMRAASREEDGSDGLVFDELNEQLVIVYAEDAPNSLSYFGPGDLVTAGVERSGLRQLAANNLVRMLPKIERRGRDGVYMISAGGDFETSLLAIGTVWKKENFDVRGDFVFAIPARGILYVTGSEDPSGIATVRGHAATDYRDSSYRISPELFLLRKGKLSVLPVQ